MIVISQDLSLAEITGQPENHPLVGYHNAILPTQVSASSAALNHAARLVAYPTTYDYWEAEDDGGQILTFATPGQWDYLGIARHNLGSMQIPIQVGGFDGSWEALSEVIIPPDDEPLLIAFERATHTSYRLVMGSGEGPAQIAVCYLGNLLALQRRIYVGHTPITYGRSENMTTGTSDSGEFLGRIFVNEHRQSSITQENITPEFYREDMRPWVESRNPFFFAWRPLSYPREVGYCWRTGAANPVNQRPNGMMSLSMNVQGIGLLP